MRSIPGTRSGNGSPSSRDAHTSDWPSALTSSAPRRISASRASLRALTAFAAASDT
jgi:hypothetical protein